MSKQKHISENNSMDMSILSENPFEYLRTLENGGSEILSDWNTVSRDRKRQRINTDENSRKVELLEYKKISTDNKLSVMFQEMNKIGQKVDECLLIHNKIDDLERHVSQHHSRLTLLEYKSLDLEARSRRNNLIFGGIAQQ